MRVCMVIPYLRDKSGGLPRVCREMSTVLSARGIEVIIATSHLGRDRSYEISSHMKHLDKAGIRVCSFRKWGLGKLRISPGLIRYLWSHAKNFSLIHIHGMWILELTWAAYCAYRQHTPYIIHPHGSLDRWSQAQSRVKKQVSMTCLGTRWMLNNAAAIIYGTIDESQEADNLRILAPVEIIPNGIYFNEFVPPRSNTRSVLTKIFPDYKDTDIILLWFSRFHYKKGLHLLIEAFAEIAPHFPRARLLAAGLPQDESYLAEQRKKVQCLGLEDRIKITTEYTGEKGKTLLLVADIFIQPSYEEGFSMAILEAMASALPLLITDTCHLPETESKAAGIVVSATSDGLVAGLRELLNLSKSELTNMGQHALKWVQTDYSWNSISEKLIAVYQEYIS